MKAICAAFDSLSANFNIRERGITGKIGWSHYLMKMIVC